MKITTRREIAGNEYELAFYDGFDGLELDGDKWLPYYLPQWSSRARARAHYQLTGQSLILTIDPEQQPWCPEFNGQIRVSSLQTGLHAGPLGSAHGQHRFNPACVVRETQPSLRLYTPHHGYIEFRARCRISPNHVAALWMIGLEEVPEHSAEICLFELKGQNVKSDSAIIGYGLHPFADPTLTDEFFEEAFALDVGDYHNYGVEWCQDRLCFYIDGKPVRTLAQSPNYPMQLMLNLYDLQNRNTTPAHFEIDYLAGFKIINKIK